MSAIYPFVNIEKRNVDLRHLRTTLLHLYFSDEFACKALALLGKTDEQSCSLEMQLPRFLVVAHALNARLHHREVRYGNSGLTLLVTLASPALPLVRYLTRNRKYHLRLRKSIESGALSSDKFDPFELFQPNLLVDFPELIEYFWIDSAPNVLCIKPFDILETLGELHSTWNLAIDRNKRTSHDVEHPIAGKRVWHAPDEQQFIQDIVKHVNETEISVHGVMSFASDIIIVRNHGAELPPTLVDEKRRLRPHLQDGEIRNLLTEYKSFTKTVSPLKLLETLDHRTGAIVRSIINATTRGSLTAVYWKTYVRTATAGSITLSDRVSKRVQRLCAEQYYCGEELAAMPSFWLVEIFCWDGGELVVPLVLTLAAVVLPVVLVVHAGLLGVAVFLGCNILLLLMLRNQRYLVLPEEFDDRSSRRNWLRRIVKLLFRNNEVRRRKVLEKWGQVDRYSKESVSERFGTSENLDLLLAEEIRFAVYAQDKAIQDSVIAVAENYGIDMEKFKEKMLEINNYGVIANIIQGSVNNHSHTENPPPADQTDPAPNKTARSPRSAAA